jgi:DNA-binding NarL/FixJ family response regulator
MRTAKRQAPPPRPRQILVVDDHPMTRHGIAEHIRTSPDLAVCGELGTANAALAAVAARPPDLVLADLSMNDRNGLELIKDLHALHPAVPVLVFSMHYESLYAERVLRAGGRGYIMKSEGAEKLMQAIREVLAGRVYLSDAMRELAVQRFAHDRPAASTDQAAPLSDRELEVFELIGQGLGTRQITRRLRVSTSTIETHRAHIKEKLKLRDATALVRAAVEWVDHVGE